MLKSTFISVKVRIITELSEMPDAPRLEIEDENNDIGISK